MEMTFRPIDEWPGELTEYRRNDPFRSNYQHTLRLLNDELYKLDASSVVIQLAIREADCRLDGMIRANTKPDHPGVILAFDSMHGPLKYHTDAFDNLNSMGYVDGWKANLRAIALGLEALRKVDRYGIGKRGEQYTGWSALPPGVIEAGAAMSINDAAKWLAQAAGDPSMFEYLIDRTDTGDVARRQAYRQAAAILHPDQGGDTELFKKLQDVMTVLDRITK